jgi:hypothetical protein
VLRAAKQAGVTVEIKIGDMVVTVSPGEKPVDDQPLVRL